MPTLQRLAILDDYQGVALTYGDEAALPPGLQTTVFREPLADADAVVAALEPFDAILAMRERTAFPAAVLDRLPDLRLLVTTGMANAAVDLEAAVRNGVTVSGTDGGGGSGTVELTWALILAAVRGTAAADASVRSGGWQLGIGGDLARRRLGVVGLGRLGADVARIGRAFGMDVVAWSPHMTADRASAAGARAVSKAELFADSDVVTVHMKLTPETAGLIGADDIGRMRPTAVLVNTSRGPLVDDDALLAALHGGRIRAAALDVFDREPLPLDSPWRSAPRTVLSPHLGYVTDDAYRVFFRDAFEDVAAYAAGSPIRVLAAPA